MKAILSDAHGGPEVLYLGDAAAPAPGRGQVSIRVAATSVNRADLVQREGRYPPPPGESPILGLEAAGTVAAVGDGVASVAPGDDVFALLPGGGYAEIAVAPAGHVLPIPHGMSFAAAACVMETYLTAWMNLFLYARLADGETVLLHGGGGGVTTAAQQLVKVLAPGARVLVTASTHKLERVRALGAARVVDYRNEDFSAVALEVTGGRGVDVILDHVGGPYLAGNVKALAVGGRLALIGILGGRAAELDLGRVLTRRLSILGSVLRSRAVDDKNALIRAFAAAVLPHFTSGALAPVVDRVLPLAQAADAHRAMAAGEHFGKLVLAVDERGMTP